MSNAKEVRVIKVVRTDSQKMGVGISPATRKLMKKAQRNSGRREINWDISAKSLLSEMKKNRKKRDLWSPSSPVRGSSMFGGVKFSSVRVVSGGLPGSGKGR